MSGYNENVKKKPYGKLIVAGIVSIGLYAILLMKQDLVNNYFALGGVYAFYRYSQLFSSHSSTVHSQEISGQCWVSRRQRRKRG